MNKLEILELIEEMGEKRIKQYIKTYIEIKGSPKNIEEFHNSFSDYIDYSKNKSKDSVGRISIIGFKFFLRDMDFEKVMRNIEEVNSRDDDHNFMYE